MRIRGYKLSYPRLLLISLIVLSALTGGVAVATSSASFGSYNPDWDGSRSLRLLAQSEAETTLARSTAAYQERPANRTTAIILSPQTEYSPSDISNLESFLNEGGTIVIAGDFGEQANRLLSGIGVKSRIDGRLVRDEQVYFRSPALPVANNISQPLNEHVSSLTLNHGTVIDPGQNASVLARTSGYSYLDVNGNGELDETETLSSHPVVVSESVGNGSVMVVSDPSIFINTMLDREGNTAFATYLVTQSDHILLDYSHSTSPPLAALIVLILQESWLLQVLLGGLLLLGIAVVTESDGIGAWIRDFRRDEDARKDETVSTDTVVKAVASQQPEWEADELREVTESIRAPDHQENDND